MLIKIFMTIFFLLSHSDNTRATRQFDVIKKGAHTHTHVTRTCVAFYENYYYSTSIALNLTHTHIE